MALRPGTAGSAGPAEAAASTAPPIQRGSGGRGGPAADGPGGADGQHGQHGQDGPNGPSALDGLNGATGPNGANWVKGPGSPNGAAASDDSRGAGRAVPGAAGGVAAPGAAGAGPRGLPAGGALPAGSAGVPSATVDLRVAQEIARRVAAELHEQLRQRPGTTREDQRQHGRALIDEAVARWADGYARTHGTSPTRAEDRALASVVFDLLFRAGRLQPYLDDELVENILVNGCDDVWISRVDEPLRRVPPIADSDEELIELLQELARQHGNGERILSTSSPTLALRLEGGMRLQAMTGVTPRPYVAIRRHRVQSATLDDMVALGTLDPGLAAFLRACIRGRRNVLIAGTQGVGKTSLLRAMANEIDPDERIGTMESEYELWLHELGTLRQVVPIEARESNGERVDGRAAGELTIGELIPPALRMSLSRLIVGEVRSHEVVPMLRAMTAGEGGSMCTLHARGPHMVLDRIAELCLEYGREMTDQLAYRLVANALDFIVYVRMVDETALGGRRHRFVSHVLEVAGLGEQGRPALNTVFGPVPGEPRAVPRTAPACLDDLLRAGFDPRVLDQPRGSWPAPLDLKVQVA
ncbi:CpaF family protein [Allostreptomyces psammosilenae]|uniref:Flp pilus assembly CpaF family ATPase n=1 Tax=Allostreptomyces psammosilenae TaxID=1892865 RepID=A0A852ZYS5_9ACTN|nr:ATPase, T2SS/T4P/T4SS family [Allostreptomyces psammosilenae]NYI03248.1 Flp pilus assembly CpaF family ATPase [Allostreptomyces psammosilenae]